MTFGRNSTYNWNTCFDSNGDYIFSNMTENRKRTREDDTCEFMPLSKRINNLHINNNLTSQPILQSADPSHINGIRAEENGISSQNPNHNSDSTPTYDPGVTSSQSRYYYENKLLFELHLERIQRSGQQFPF
ncbi:PREDICTED: uncharacterized protein LOC106118885 [Papilio xuthus]|uniref:Uncharacterized protein LOC106118885 n=2 Tax=Papilio xuthus TaxID=66420 RepID=A0AAJ6ZBI3_PAPXU|nr:PREDICTED: uncharacterized protein LOC106118885 [Papilio xuthus]